MGKEPHYHFQMRINGKPFIDFGDFHLPLTPDDIKAINIQRGQSKIFAFSHGPGASLQEFIERTGKEKFIDTLQKSDEKEATVHLKTLIEAEEGTTISGDDIADLMEEHKRTGIPMATLLKKLPNIKQTTYIEPSDNIPKMASRKPRKNR